MEGGELMIVSGMFEGNNPGIASYPSLRRNVVCASSTVTVESLIGGDGITNDTSLWMIDSDSNCTMSGLARTYSSYFFIPIINGASILSDTQAVHQIRITGELLIPCGLWWKLELDGEKIVNGTVEQIEGGRGTIVNESVVTVSITQDEYSSYSHASVAVIRLLYRGSIESGEGEHATSTPLYETGVIVMKNESRAGRSRLSRGGSRKDGSLYPVLLVLFIVMLLLVVLSVIIILGVLKYCKRYKEQTRKADWVDHEGMYLSSAGLNDKNPFISADELDKQGIDGG